MPVSLGTKGQAGFEHPFELLSDCHRRIESFLAVTRRALEHYAERTMDRECEAALRGVLRYFREAAPRHTQDEEVSLFPRLRELGRDDLRELLDAAERLECDHEEAEKLHHGINRRLESWIEARRLDPDAAAALDAELETLERLYARHIAFEDKTLFPAAAGALDPEQVRQIGHEMAARRGLRYDGTRRDDPST
jgi:hemerythrin-like domain-containing protein